MTFATLTHKTRQEFFHWRQKHFQFSPLVFLFVTFMHYWTLYIMHSRLKWSKKVTKIAFWLILLLLAKWRENLNLAKIAFALILFTATKWRENLNLARYARLWKKVTFFILNFALGGDGTIFSRKTNPSFTDAKKKKCTCSSREGKKKPSVFAHCKKR